MSEFKTKFHPVQGKEETLKSLGYNEGWLYFATDTKRIFLDSQGIEKMPMGGNSGVYYGKMALSETPDENQKEFSFKTTDLEINDNSDSITIPNIDDLILNIPDGCFYRVFEIEKNDNTDIKINTIKLTIAGGGGITDGPASLAGVVFNRITPQSFNTLLDIPCEISFTVTAKDTAGELTGPGTYRLTVDGIEKARGVINNNNPDDPEDFNTIDVSSYLHTGDNTIKIYASMDTGGSSSVETSKTWKINAISISTKWNPSFTEANPIEKEFEINWEIIGGPGIEKTTHIIIDDHYEIVETTTSTGTQTKLIKPSEFGLNHGSHKFELYVSVTIGFTTQSTPSIVKNIMFKENNNENYIINYDFYKNSMIQYDTIKIPVTIYSSSNTLGDAIVTFKENGVDKGVKTNFKNGMIHEFAYTPVNYGSQILSFACGQTEKILIIEVEPLGVEIKEIPNYAFKFKASEFVDNNSIENWSNNNVEVSFSEQFDWINGGLKTEEDDNGNSRQYVCVKAGSLMTIDYNVFGQDARTNGKCVKIIFKATKCKDYDAQILSCHDGKRGLILKAQNAIFNSSNINMNIPYCEDNYIELELDITSTKEKKYYVRPWIDGVPVGIKIYSTSDDFFTEANNKLVIGSNDCDVYIYLIKVYEKHLKDEEHLSNFIADASTSSEILNRYRRNDILDENKGDISPIKLAKKNPNCKVHLYTMDRMTKTKNDPVDNCSYTQYQGSDIACLTAKNVTVKVQGTSSAAYGLAAFNLDSKFKDGFSDDSGKHFDKWAMSQNSIPVNYFCTKVNVASAEGANNALNQEWYNRYQPYKTVARGKNPKARDTMEFTPGVLFIEDLNPQRNDTEFGGKGDNVFKDNDDYCSATNADGTKLISAWPKMYSVCNMGNSKKNIEVFHDLDNPYECCIENKDNQLPGQWMVVPQGGYKQGEEFILVDIMSIDDGAVTVCPDGQIRSNRALWEAGMDYVYEFRYPDGIEEVKKLDPIYAEAMITGWFRFVKWMAENNPSEKYAIVNFKDDWISQTYKTEEEFFNDPHQKYIFDNQTNEYQLVEEYENNKTIYYIFLTAAEHFERYPKQIFVLQNDNEEDKKKHLGYHIEVSKNKENYNPEETYYYITEHIYGASNEPIETETIEAKKFQGYKAPGELSKYQEDYTPILAGHTESEFAGTYSYDTQNYRIAKMLQSCEDYLCMDSVVFHYLFIERHSLVDNVAKNTFWSTEDGLVWNLTKDYDNDTSDGNNNQGTLELSYGLEPGDKDSKGISVFNAGNSVWLNFIRKLYSTCQKMYVELDVEKNGRPSAWSPTAYLKLFKEWQSSIPERCWIEDYYRKYIRPYEVYEDEMFLSMHEGGKKTYQREQYETYQNYYISSKYFGTSCSTNYFTLRPNGTDLSDFKIPITLYSDCYVHGAFGNNGLKPNFTKRCKRNDPIYMSSPITNATDSTTYLFPANLYQTLGDVASGLNNLNLEQFTVTSAKKLRTLSLGTYNSAISNSYLTDFSLKSCENLEELYIAKMNNSNLAELDLSQIVGIKIVDARDSEFSSILIATGAPLKKLYINKPNSIILSDLRNLETLSIQQPKFLTKIDINNIDTSEINSKNNIIDLTSNLQSARVLNVIWTIDKASEIENNEISILELLRKTSFRNENGELIPQTEILSGNLFISENAYNDSNSINIYNNYINEEVYPKLDIIFKGEKAKLPKVYIYNGNDKICWSRRIVNNIKMTEEFLMGGPFGQFNLQMIYKQSTPSTDFVFENKWEVYDGQGNKIGDITGSNPIYSEVIDEDIYIKPIFTSNIRKYTLQFYTYNTETQKVDKPYGDAIIAEYGTLLADIMPNEVPWKPEDDSYKMKEANNFIGYGLTPQSLTPVSLETIVANDQNFYAIFERVPDVSNIIHSDWFIYEQYSYEREDNDSFSKYPEVLPDNKLGKIEGYAIKPSKKLNGKITIPSQHPEDKKPIVAISTEFASGDSQNITHLFCEKNSQLYEIQSLAFKNNKVLKYFDFSQNTVRFIDKEAFRSCSGLDADNVKLSNQIFFVGEYAFTGAFNKNCTIKVFNIPGSIGLIQGRGFSNLNLPDSITIAVGNEETPSKLLASYPDLSANANNIEKFTQNYIRNFSFWSKRYENLEEFILNLDGTNSGYQVFSLFVRNSSDYNKYTISMNGRI